MLSGWFVGWLWGITLRYPKTQENYIVRGSHITKILSGLRIGGFIAGKDYIEIKSANIPFVLDHLLYE